MCSIEQLFDGKGILIIEFQSFLVLFYCAHDFSVHWEGVCGVKSAANVVLYFECE